VRDHQRAVVLRIDRDEQLYMKAFNELNEAVKENFGGNAKMSSIAIPDKFKQEKLPRLPGVLRTYVDQVPKEIEDE